MPEAAKAIHRRTLSARYAWVESQLAGKDYLMGSDFTVADASLFVVTGWAGFVDVDLGACDNVRALMARVAPRPAVQEAMKAEGLLQ